VHLKVAESERLYDSAFDKHANPEELRRNIQIVDPPIIRENIGQLNILGKAGSILLQLLSVVSEHNRSVAKVDPTGPLLGLLGERLKKMETLVQQAQEEIGSP
jgi:hypothetical protein